MLACRVRPGVQDVVRAFRHGPRIERARQIAANAHRFGSDSFHCAVALNIAVPLYGRVWANLCVWCLERAVGDVPPELMFRLSWDPKARDWCARCPYNGCDVLIASIDVNYP